MQKCCYIAIAFRLSGSNSSSQNSPKNDSSASSTSSLSCSPSSTKDTSTLNLAYAIINMNEPKIFSEIELTDAEDLKQVRIKA